mmetsp:Transcript_17685/g.24947  ORF Transcript_17685/g.24947 Transcript_17685/m.24947 type:complete len:237 (+) Transcript_17685:105-815(+)|eukprot:CAMPEP_0184858598 /NCGR_PEP_ID=MMETSP0580-20130426/3675_1 /TAXON_ID=1118495 /ORGANISM="Dactyliosolen fragilissimus" /LENGTH=236 /DNA_ID=CAMNT_0027354827 /DNA_START=42 /DNA_END=752 /DNA_ORIENTATION=-
MVKISQLVLPLVLISGAAAFAPANSRAFVSRPVFESVEAAEPEPAPPAPVAPEPTPEVGGALVPIKEETVEFTAGLIGGAVGFAVGGPVLAAITAAAANYASKTDLEVGEVVQAVSKSSIEVYNYLAKLDSKYELLTKAKKTLEDSLEKIKAADNVDPETVKKVEAALDSTTTKINEINDEYDLVGAGVTALGVIGDLVEKAVMKAGELNEEYKLTEKAFEAIQTAVSKAKDAAKN